MVEGNSCDSTKDQLEAVSPQRVPHLLGVYVSAPLQETEGDGGRQEDRGERGGGLRCRCVNWKHVGKCSCTVTEQEKSPQTGAVGGGDWVGR